MSKTKDEFLDHFARLGVFSKVQALMGSDPDSDSNNDVIKSSTLENAVGLLASSSSGKGLFWKFFFDGLANNEPFLFLSADDPQEDAKEILQGKAYHWREWSICRGRDCLYVWSDSAALELSNGSNGWFRFILDGKLATMYSSGSPENGNDSSGIFLFLSFSFISLCLPLISYSYFSLRLHLDASRAIH